MLRGANRNKNGIILTPTPGITPAQRRHLLLLLLTLRHVAPVWDDRVARLDDRGGFEWIATLRRKGPLPIPEGQSDRLVAALLDLPRLPRLQLPPELQ